MTSSEMKTQVLAQPTPVSSGAVPDIAAALATRYEILDTLGEGGMGLVFRVRDRETSETLALKILRPEIARDPSMMERFKDEIRLARRITHKNVCRIYDFNRVEDLAFITMEYVDGESLRDYLKRAGKFSPERVLDLARQISAGLGEAHAQGVVHRDLKPENVMLARDGLVKIMDFGIARALGDTTATTLTAVGTPGYMAPEQSQGRSIDQRTDLYALGLILYECLTSRRAFAGSTPVEVALKQLKERPVPPHKFLPHIPAHLESIVLRCIEKEPTRRFSSASELLRALARPIDTAVRTPRWRMIVMIIVMAFLLLVVVQRVMNIESPSSSEDFTDSRQIPEELIKLFEAAKQGDASAQERVGRLYLDGPERARDERKAFYWIRRAALSGDQNAQYTLGRMYEAGRGVKPNVIGAYVWYKIAMASGSDMAREAHSNLVPNLSREQLTEAEQLIDKLRQGQKH